MELCFAVLKLPTERLLILRHTVFQTVGDLPILLRFGTRFDDTLIDILSDRDGGENRELTVL